MKKQSIKQWILSVLSLSVLFSSCGKDTPGSTSTSDDPNLKGATPNIIEVSSLLRSIGKIETPEDKPFVPSLGKPTITDVGERKNEITGNVEQHQKVVTPVTYDYVSSSEDFALLNPWPSVLWPGCLVQGETLYGKNVPATVPIYKKRKPGRIMLQLVSGTGEDEAQMYEEVADMRESNVLQAQNKLLARYLKSGMPASVTYSLEAVHSIEELAVLAGVDVNRSFLKLKASFGHELSKEKNYMLVRLYQRFFTMSYEDPDGGFRGVFTDDITKEDLAPFTGNGNPLCYISSVSYGRVYYLLVESSNSHQQMTATLHAAFAGIQVDGSYEKTKALQEFKVKMIQLGGDAKTGLQGAVSGNFSDVAKFIIDGARLSRENVGAPISFTVKHLYDGSMVRMSNALKYSYEKVEFVPKNKESVVGIHIKDISSSPIGIDDWTISNRGHIEIRNVKVLYYLVGADSPIQKIVPLARSRYNIQDALFMPIYQTRSETTMKGTRINRVTIQAELAIKSSAYTSWKRREESDEQIVTLSRSFYYDQDRWVANSRQPADVYSKIKVSHRIGKVNFDLSLNFDFFVDSHLIRE